MKSSTEWIYKDLNDNQLAAVKHLDGPVLILAGAGSGKTRVLTFRIANILAQNKAEPYQILSMTFTNKAASEMRERIEKLVPDKADGMWIGTFHSLFARLLRRDGDKIGYNSNFTIYDVADQVTLLKTILADLKLPAQEIPPKMVQNKISNAKNAMILPDEYIHTVGNPMDEAVAKIYKIYERRLLENNAMDFDDLLIKPIELFSKNPDIQSYYQDRFKYILVDEYQDTNHAQYRSLKMLSGKTKNICVVGDDDQSIYRWRGADLRNILEFESDYPDCQKFRLEQNYRSTKNILSAAHSVIVNNVKRHEKELWTEREPGEQVTLTTLYDEREESRYIVGQIGNEFRKAERRFYDFAILYRTNAQSRVLEEALRIDGIPYIIVGGVKFYERKEVKDVLAYLKVLVNPADSISLKRIINYPLRGIGETTIHKLELSAYEKNTFIYDILKKVQDLPGIAEKTAKRVHSFYKLLKKYRSLRQKVSPTELATSLVEETGILKQFKEDGSIESQTRAENIRELLVAIAEYSNQSNSEATLEEFLQHVTLTTDIDTWDDKTNAVTMMTLHAAKGLEFPVVFMTGLEEGLFPTSRSLDDPHALEEERRLFYVGATRAKDKLYITLTKFRQRFGENPARIKSRFIKELDSQFVQYEQSRTVKSKEPKRPKFVYEADPMPDYENMSQESTEYSVGMRVNHLKFGKGNILKIEPSHGTFKLLVVFDQVGEKRLVLPYAKLEIL